MISDHKPFEMKKILIIGFLMQHLAGAAQTRQPDSLQLIQRYLLEIRKAVTVQKWDGQKQFQQISGLLERGMVYYQRLPQLLKQQTTVSDDEQATFFRTFRYVVQTLALYKADMKESGLKRPANKEDDAYLTNQTHELSNQLAYIRRGAGRR